MESIRPFSILSCLHLLFDTLDLAVLIVSDTLGKVVLSILELILSLCIGHVPDGLCLGASTARPRHWK